MKKKKELQATLNEESMRIIQTVRLFQIEHLKQHENHLGTSLCSIWRISLFYRVELESMQPPKWNKNLHWI